MLHKKFMLYKEWNTKRIERGTTRSNPCARKVQVGEASQKDR